MPAQNLIDLSHPSISAEAQAFLSKPHRHYIGGEWIESQSGERRKVFDPATGLVISAPFENSIRFSPVTASQSRNDRPLA